MTTKVTKVKSIRPLEGYGDMSDAAKGALQWLEQQPPPQIIVPVSSLGSRLTTFVPNNDMNVVAAAWARGKKPEKKPEKLRTEKFDKSIEVKQRPAQPGIVPGMKIADKSVAPIPPEIR